MDQISLASEVVVPVVDLVLMNNQVKTRKQYQDNAVVPIWERSPE